MKNVVFRIVAPLAGLVFLGLAGFFYAQYLKSLPASEREVGSFPALDKEDVANLAKPAVVRIIQHTRGTVAFPLFDIDIENLSILPDPQGRKTKEYPVDSYIAGSGFIINQDGYILTNSHIASYQSAKLSHSAAYGSGVIFDALLRYDQKKSSSEDALDLQAQEEEEAKGEQLANAVLDFIIANGRFELEKEVIVLRPDSTKEKLSELLGEGYEAKVISVNDNYFKDNKDIALIKIAESGLPSIALGGSASIATGEPISIFGFPASAEFNSKNLLEASFTTGTINAFKDSDNKDFKIFQTDAKISQGSSGGPLLNRYGQVIGLITYQSGDEQRESGDNFAFALPSDRIVEWVESFKVDPENYPAQLFSGSYQQHLSWGIAFSRARQCQQALTELDLAARHNPRFLPEKGIDSYRNKCLEIIAEGESIDTRWDEKMEKLRQTRSGTWLLLGGGALLFLILMAAIIFLLRRLRKDEKEIAILEEQSRPHEPAAIPTVGRTAAGSPAVPSPNQAASAAGQHDLPNTAGKNEKEDGGPAITFYR